MKILILSQIVDKNDSMLGFFHVWLEEFSKQFENIHVICLKEGEHSLPRNISVHSLGKEDGVSKFEYIVRFFRYVWNYRKEYDAVFVHMNQEYVLLGGWLWRLLGKRVTMWRNHNVGDFLTDFASLFCHKVFCTSKFSYTAKYKKTIFMPVGISTSIFYPRVNEKRKPHSILFLGRVSPSKRIEYILDAVEFMRKKGVECILTICGDVSKEHEAYKKEMQGRVQMLELEDVVSFREGVSYEKTPEVYSAHEVCINQSSSGMFDKTIFEAMLCGTLSLSCNENLRGMIDEVFLFKEDDVQDLASKLEKILLFSRDEREKKVEELVRYTEENHSLQHLSKRLKEELEFKK